MRIIRPTPQFVTFSQVVLYRAAIVWPLLSAMDWRRLLRVRL